jgi:hypothetical protein
VRPGPYANSVGIIQTFDYQVRKPNAAQVLWDHARTIYAGYEAYASRIKSREIHIMILSAERPQ